MNAIANFFKDPKKVIALLIKLGFIGGIFGFMFFPEAFMGFFSRILPFEVSLKKFKGISIGELWESIRGLDLAIAAKWLTFAAIVKIAGIFCGITRWHILLKGQGISLPFW